MNPNTNLTLCITSCNRHDLLRATMESFFAYTDLQPQQILVYEDSDQPMPEWLKAWEWQRRQPFKWLSDGARKGQAYACARLIQEAKHDWVMWLEDDWLFQRGSGPFIHESKAILESNPDIIKVSLRGDTGWHPLELDSRGFKIAKPYWRGVWGGWAWNPGVSRLGDVKALLPRLGPQIGQDGLKHEEALSKDLLDAGRRIADLNRQIVAHIGGGRSRSIEKLPPLPKILVAVPTCFEFDYETHSLQNEEKFHVNGPNDQTEAIRETWGKDFAKYPTVDVRFFYGKPANGYPRPAKPDEVFFECGDGYDSLIQKSTEICRYAAEHGYQFLFKCDTDTWVYAERLLIEIMENHFDYAGFRHANVASGGPGYLLSAHACRIIATQGRQPRHPYAEDVHVARVLAANGITPLMLPDHHSGMSAHFFFGDPKTFDPTKIPEGLVTAHAIFPDQMRAWHRIVVDRNRMKEAQNAIADTPCMAVGSTPASDICWSNQ